MTAASPQIEASSAVRPTRAKTPNDFTELSQLVTTSGLMRRRYGYYWTKLLAVPVVLAALVSPSSGSATPGGSWSPRPSWPWCFTQVAMLGHDAAHRQIFRSGRWNDWTSLVIANLFVGMSYGWWQHKHTRHHANPNKIGADPDIDLPVISFTPDQADRRRASRRGPLGWLMAHQGVFFFPILLLEGLSLHASSVRRVFSREPLRRRRSRSPSSPSASSAIVAARVPGALARDRLRVPRRAARPVRRLHGHVVRAEPQGHAARPGRGEDGLPAASGADEPQHPRRPPARHRDGRPQLPDRAPPVPVDAAPASARAHRR